jgi:hypothetical protein
LIFQNLSVEIPCLCNFTFVDDEMVVVQIYMNMVNLPLE